MINIDDFAKIEIRVGLVTEAVNKDGSDKLIRLTVDFGTETRIIFTGVRSYGYTPEDFANKKFLFVTNLEYKKMLDEESQGMILAVDSTEGKPIFVETPNLPIGSKVR
jgi:methionine--tRNA ligase beta chain